MNPQKPWQRLLFSGGIASKLEILRKVIQQRFGASYRTTPFEEDTLLGLLILPSVFSGRAPSIEGMTEKLRRELV